MTWDENMHLRPTFKWQFANNAIKLPTNSSILCFIHYLNKGQLPINVTTFKEKKGLEMPQIYGKKKKGLICFRK